MIRRLSLVSTTFFAILLVLQPVPTTGTGPDTTMLGVSVGDSFTYVLDEYVYVNAAHQIAKNSTTGDWLTVNENGEFNITIKDITVTQDILSHHIEVVFANTTHTLLSDLEISIGSFILFTDWDYYQADITTSLQDTVNSGEIHSYEVINGETEFVWGAKGTLEDPEGFIEYRFDKTTGMLLYLHWNWTPFGDPYIVKLRQNGYVRPNETIGNSILISSDTESSNGILSSTSIFVSNAFAEDNSSSTISAGESETSAGPIISGFGGIISFTALIAIFTVIRYKKH